MRYVFICLSILFLSPYTVLAQEQPSKIQELITQIKSAEPSDKRALMNELKVQLRALNQESRKKVMMGLRKTFNKKGSPMQIRKNAPAHSGKASPQEKVTQQKNNRPMKNRQRRGK